MNPNLRTFLAILAGYVTGAVVSGVIAALGMSLVDMNSFIGELPYGDNGLPTSFLVITLIGNFIGSFVAGLVAIKITVEHKMRTLYLLMGLYVLLVLVSYILTGFATQFVFLLGALASSLTGVYVGARVGGITEPIGEVEFLDAEFSSADTLDEVPNSKKKFSWYPLIIGVLLIARGAMRLAKEDGLQWLGLIMVGIGLGGLVYFFVLLGQSSEHKR